MTRRRAEPTIPALLHHTYATLIDDPVPDYGRVVGGSAADRRREQEQLPPWARLVLTWAWDADVEAFQRAERAADLKPAPAAPTPAAPAHEATPGTERPALRLVRPDATPADDVAEIRRAARWARGRADGFAWWVRHLPTLVGAYADGGADDWRITVHRHVTWSQVLAQLERRGGQWARASGWWAAAVGVRQLLESLPLPRIRSPHAEPFRPPECGRSDLASTTDSGSIVGPESRGHAVSSTAVPNPAPHFTRLLAQVEQIVEASGDPELRPGFDAAEWLADFLSTAHPALRGRVPNEYLNSPEGVELVSALIGAQQSGAYW